MEFKMYACQKTGFKKKLKRPCPIVEKFRSDLKANINIGAYPGGGLIYRYPQKTGKIFLKNLGRFGPDPAQILHGVIIWYSLQMTQQDPKKAWYIYSRGP